MFLMLASGRLGTEEKQKLKASLGHILTLYLRKKNRYKQTKYLWKYLIFLKH